MRPHALSAGGQSHRCQVSRSWGKGPGESGAGHFSKNSKIHWMKTKKTAAIQPVGSHMFNCFVSGAGQMCWAGSGVELITVE